MKTILIILLIVLCLVMLWLFWFIKVKGALHRNFLYLATMFGGVAAMIYFRTLSGVLALVILTVIVCYVDFKIEKQMLT